MSAHAIRHYQYELQNSLLYTSGINNPAISFSLFYNFRQFKDFFLNTEKSCYTQEEVAVFFMNKLLTREVLNFAPQKETLEIFEFLLSKKPIISFEKLNIIASLLNPETSEKLLELLLKYPVPLPALEDVTQNQITTLWCSCRSKKVMTSLHSLGIPIEGSQIFQKLYEKATALDPNLAFNPLTPYLKLCDSYEKLKTINSTPLPWKWAVISLSPIAAIPKWLAYVQQMQKLMLFDSISKPQNDYQFVIDGLSPYLKACKKFVTLPCLNTHNIQKRIYVEIGGVERPLEYTLESTSWRIWRFLSSCLSKKVNGLHDIIMEIHSTEAPIIPNENIKITNRNLI